MDGVACPPGSFLAWSNTAFRSTGSIVGLMVSSNKVYTKGDLPRCSCQCPHPCGEPLLTHISTGDPPTLAGSFDLISCGFTAPFVWVLVHAKFCLCSLRLESLFAPVVWKSYNQIPLVFKVRFPRNSQSFCQIPRLGSLMWSSEPSQQ